MSPVAGLKSRVPRDFKFCDGSFDRIITVYTKSSSNFLWHINKRIDLMISW